MFVPQSESPVEAIEYAQVLAAGYGVYAGKIILNSHKTLLGINLDLIIIVGLKDIFTCLTTQRQSIGKPTKVDVTVIRYESETQTVSKFVWVPGKLSLTDVGLKFDNLLTPVSNDLLQI